MACNSLPDNPNDPSYGLERRFVVIPFHRNFHDGGSRPEKEILQELDAERGEFIYWALEGAATVMDQDGYSIPDSHYTALQGWKEDSCPIQRFVSECLVRRTEGSDAKDCFLSLDKISNLYDSWRIPENEFPMTNRKLSSSLKQMDGIRVYRKSVEGKKVTGANVKVANAWSSQIAESNDYELRGNEYAQPRYVRN